MRSISALFSQVFEFDRAIQSKTYSRNHIMQKYRYINIMIIILCGSSFNLSMLFFRKRKIILGDASFTLFRNICRFSQKNIYICILFRKYKYCLFINSFLEGKK